MDACYRSAKSGAVGAGGPVRVARRHDAADRGDAASCTRATSVIKREVLPDGRLKLILKDPATGDFVDRVIAGA